uniref:Putative ovule protein n=1 Tax=Solanum chacoense TaxID=4108 RepID=A0A0V0IVG5_SOLCH
MIPLRGTNYLYIFFFFLSYFVIIFDSFIKFVLNVLEGNRVFQTAYTSLKLITILCIKGSHICIRCATIVCTLCDIIEFVFNLNSVYVFYSFFV